MDKTKRYRLLRAAAAAFLLVLLVLLGGCAQASPDQGGSADGVPFTQADVDRACDDVRQSFAGANVIGVDAQVDEAGKTVYLTVTSLSQSVPEACTAAEEACRQLSAAAVNAMIDRLSDEGDEDARQRYEELASSETDRAGGLGALYETYALSLRIDNDEGTLDIDGVRDAGPEGSVNWQ